MINFFFYFLNFRLKRMIGIDMFVKLIKLLGLNEDFIWMMYGVLIEGILFEARGVVVEAFRREGIVY